MSRGADIISTLEELIIAIRTRDMVDIARIYVEHLLALSRLAGDRAWHEEASPEEKASALNDLADRLMKSSLGYAPLANSGLVLQRLARRIQRGDPILGAVSLPRILRCVVDVLDKFLANAVVKATEQCSRMSYDTVALHVWGSLSYRCAQQIATNARRPKFLVFGNGARAWAKKLKQDTGAGVTVLPPLYAYQAARFADAILFQPETVTPGYAIARTGIAPVLEYPEPGEDVTAIGATISLAYHPRRGVLLQSYDKLPRTGHRVLWQEIIEIPIFDLIVLENTAPSINLIDERGETQAKPAILRRKAMAIVRELEELVEARCRVYEPSP